MNAAIDVRLSDPSNLEIIRDQISGIIAIEMANQYEKAVEDADPVKDDYKVGVYVENDEPWNTNEDNIFPLVNIMIDHVEKNSDSTINTTIRNVQFSIDCYQTGNYSGKYAGRKATIKAWKLARCVSKILDSDEYTYLGLRGVVKATSIDDMRLGRPDTNSAMKVYLVRIRFNVEYVEDAPQNSGTELKTMPVTISDENGQVVIDITEDITEEE